MPRRVSPLDAYPRGNRDPRPSHQRYLGQRDLRGGQLGLAEVQPGAADEADHDHMAVHPPRPVDPQAADRRDVPGRRTGGPAGDSTAGRSGIRRKVGDQAVKIRKRLGAGPPGLPPQAAGKTSTMPAAAMPALLI